MMSTAMSPFPSQLPGFFPGLNPASQLDLLHRREPREVDGDAKVAEAHAMGRLALLCV
jgi:hypothetical protein